MDQSGRVEIPGTTSRCWSFPLQHEVGDCGSRMGTVWTRHALSSVYFRKTRHGWGERGNELMTKFFFQKEKEGWKFLRIFSNIFFFWMIGLKCEKESIYSWERMGLNEGNEDESLVAKLANKKQSWRNGGGWLEEKFRGNPAWRLGKSGIAMGKRVCREMTEVLFRSSFL